MIDTKALREKVLDLAIRGKLVPQDPNNEPASVLLERIRAQKEQMVKEGKLKAKDIKNDIIIFKGEDNLHYEKFQDGTVKCIEDEIPFEVPDSWKWCRLGLIFAHNTGKALNSSDTTGAKLTYITTSNLYWDRFELDSLKEMLFTDSEIEKCTVTKGDLLVCEGGDIGRAAIWTFDEEIRIQNHIHRLRPYITLSNRFFYYVFYLWKCIERIGGRGIGLQGFSSKALHQLIVPVPPFAEQHAIVSKLDYIFNFIDKLEAQKIELLNVVANIKSKILDLAIHGKLVPQDPDDEPASVLLERIRAEKEELIKQGKIKRDKKESIIFRGDDNSYYEKIDGVTKKIDDKLLFDIPENWRWERLGNISTIARGGSPRPIDKYLTTKENGINWIKISDTEQGGKYIYNTREKIIPEGVSKTRYVKNGDFLLTNSMSFGRPYILKTNGCIHDGWLVIGDIENVFYQDFLYYALSSDFMYNSFSELASGSTVKNLKSDTVKSVFFPVPPLKEQEKISRYLENLYSIIAQIEQGLN